MTKFEEEVNKYNIFERTVYLEGGPKKILIDHFKNWHSDEEFQAEKDARKKEYEIHQDIYSKTSKKLNEAELEIANLKSQLQQQALPVVPDFVAEWYEEEKDRLEFAVYVINTSIYIKYANDRTTIEEWFARADNKPIETVFKMKDGYTVEKPQLFYLKNKLTTSYLELDKTNDYFHHTMNPAPYYDMTRKSQFTQQEIDSMETGRYEQIEVTE